MIYVYMICFDPFIFNVFFFTRFGWRLNLLWSFIFKEAFHQNDIMKTVEAYEHAKATLEDPQMLEEEMSGLYHLIENWKPNLIIGCTVAWYLALLFAKMFRIPAIIMSLQLDRPCRSLPCLGIGERFPKFMNATIWWLVVTYLTV